MKVTYTVTYTLQKGKAKKSYLYEFLCVITISEKNNILEQKSISNFSVVHIYQLQQGDLNLTITLI